MGNFSERIPGVATLHNVANRLFPVTDECAGTYHKLAGLSIAISAYTTEQTVSWAEQSFNQARPAEIIGTLVLATIPTASAGFFWHRGWRSRGEIN